MSVRQIAALEEDDYGKLSGGTFLRGFVRNYAKLVRIDSAPLLLLLPPPPQIIAHSAEKIPFPGSQKSVWRRLIVAGVSVAALSLLVYEIYQGNETAQQPVARATVAPEIKVEPVAEQLESELPNLNLSSDIAPESVLQEVAVVEQVTSNPSAQQREKIVPVVAAPDLVSKGEGVLRFTFAGESWVEINDGAGKMILSQLNPLDSQLVIRGKAPLYVVIGNAANVKLVYNNKLINLVQHTNTKGGVARLSLE
jgi:cytoskeleton protein RodZ